MEHLSLKRLRGVGLGGELLHWGLEDMLGKSLDTGISLHGGPFLAEGNLVCMGGGLVYRGL